MIGQGVSSRSSHSAAAGRTTFSANPCTHSRMSFWSWFSAIENSPAGSCPVCWASAARAVASVVVAASIASVLLRSRTGRRMVLTAWSVSAVQARSQREGEATGARNRGLVPISWMEEWLMRDEVSLSEVEPELGAIEAYETRAEEPLFPLVIRGYDRRSVEEYVEAATARLNELETMQSPSLAVQ